MSSLLEEDEIRDKEEQDSPRGDVSSQLGGLPGFSISSSDKQDPNRSQSNNGGDAGQNINGGDQLNLGYNADKKEKPNLVRTIASQAAGNRKGLAVGGGVVGIAISLVFSFLNFASFELVHIEQVLVRDAEKIVQHFEQQATNGDVSDTLTNAEDKTPAEESDEVKSAEAEDGVSDLPLTEEMDQFSVDSPATVAALDKAGIYYKVLGDGKIADVEVGGGKLTSTTDDGNFSGIDTTEFDVGQTEDFPPIMTDDAQADFDTFGTGEENDNATQAMESDVIDGANDQLVVQAATETEEDKPPTDTQGLTPAELKAEEAREAADETESGPLESSVEGAESEFKKTGNEQQAIDTGVAEFEEATEGAEEAESAEPTALATTACTIDETVEDAAVDRVPQILTLLIRHGTMFINLASELQQGKLSGKQLSGVMTYVNGTNSTASNATSISSNPSKTPESALPWTAAASWRTATGTGTNSDSSSAGYTPSIDEAALPTKNAGTNIVESLNHDVPGGLATCKALTSTFGMVVQGLAGLGDIIVNIPDFEGEELAQTAATIAGILTINKVVLPNVLKYFTNLAITGTEDHVQEINNTAGGLHAAFADYGRHIGGNPLTAEQSTKIIGEEEQEQINSNSQKSMFYRAFAISNPFSITSQLINKLPIDTEAVISNLGNDLVNIPEAMMHDFSTIFNPRLSFAAAYDTPSSMYDITDYGFTDSNVHQYSPTANEEYLYGNIEVPNGSGGTTKVQRIAALGNPATTTGQDSSMTDLLHCYTDSFQVLMIIPAGTANDCGDVGDLSTDGSPTNVPNDNTVAQIYCNAAGNSSSRCVSSLLSSGQIDNDVGRFCQYMLDLHVMNDLTSLTNGQ